MVWFKPQIPRDAFLVKSCSPFHHEPSVPNRRSRMFQSGIQRLLFNDQLCPWLNSETLDSRSHNAFEIVRMLRCFYKFHFHETAFSGGDEGEQFLSCFECVLRFRVRINGMREKRWGSRVALLLSNFHVDKPWTRVKNGCFVLVGENHS